MGRFLFFILFWSGMNTVAGQVGGQSSFEFLNIPSNARVAGLGNVNISLMDQDVNLFYSNPALLNSAMDRHLSVNYQLYLGDTRFSSVSYAHEFDKWGTWGANLQYFNYGEIDSFDPSGVPIGTFAAREYAFTIGHSHQVGNFSMGANLRVAVSSIAGYTASALLFDIGGTFNHPKHDFTASLLFKNLGFMLSDYTSESSSGLPFDLQVGTSFKPKDMPVRFSLTAYNLTNWDVAFYDPSGDGEPGKEEPGTFDKIFSHFVIGTELIIKPNIHLRAGYNHMIRKELQIEQASGGAGFSFGLMFRVKGFEFAYTRSLYHVAAGANIFTLTGDLNKVFKKRKEFSNKKNQES